MPTKIELNNLPDGYLNNNYMHKSNWLEVSILNAHGGILSTACLAMGMTIVSEFGRITVVLATAATLIAGALSMTASKYIFVSSQNDIEKADFTKRKKTLEEMTEFELLYLAETYEKRISIAKELPLNDAFTTYIQKDSETNIINTISSLQTAFSSLAFFAL